MCVFVIGLDWYLGVISHVLVFVARQVHGYLTLPFMTYTRPYTDQNT